MIVRYFVVGGIAALVDWLLFALLNLALGLPWFPAATAGFIAATVVNYLLSIRFVFQSGVRFRRAHELGLVFAVSGVGLLVNQLCMWLLIAHFGAPAMLAKMQATAAVFLWNYSVRYFFIFAAPR